MVNNLFRILIFLIIMISCNEKKLIDKFKDFDQRGWVSNTPSIFNFSTKDLDYITNVSLRIKYDIEYPYQNLYYNFNIFCKYIAVALPDVLGFVAIITSSMPLLIRSNNLSKDNSEGPIPSNGEIAPPRT